MSITAQQRAEREARQREWAAREAERHRISVTAEAGDVERLRKPLLREQQLSKLIDALGMLGSDVNTPQQRSRLSGFASSSGKQWRELIL